jgi:hypothetical protein
MVDKQKPHKNFGQLKTLYNGVLAESISTGDKKRKGIFKDYIKALKENESLKTQFYIFNNIENKIESDKDKAIEFVKENISLMNKFSKKEITNSYPKLVKPIIENNGFGYDYSNEDLKELHENISFLINTEKNGKTIDSIIEATHKVADYIVNNKKQEPVVEGLGDIVLSNNDLSKLMVSKFNKEYGKSLSESEVLLLKDILISNSDDTKKNVMFKESIKECLTLVNDKLKNADSDLKMSLLDLKENLLDKQYNNNNFEIDILRLNSLKENLR